MILGTFVLIIALGLSGIAAYYSIVGLAAIFAAAVLPIIIMAGALETAKIATTIWLHQYWRECKFVMKAYLTMAVVVLMFITSLGIFGFLSRAHVEQSITAGDNTVMLTEIDRRVEIERKRIVDAEAVIAQLDQTVQVLMDAQRIRGAEGAIAVRQSQLTERETLNAVIDSANESIMELQQRRVPLLQDQLTIEAKVGPLKYIAAMVYGTDLNEDMLEEAVRWVIILLVIVFDPLAIMLVLAGVESFSWSKRKKENATAVAEQQRVLEENAQKWQDELAFREEQDKHTNVTPEPPSPTFSKPYPLKFGGYSFTVPTPAEEPKQPDTTLQDIYDDLAASQVDLDPEMAQIIDDNRWELYDEEIPEPPVESEPKEPLASHEIEQQGFDKDWTPEADTLGNENEEIYTKEIHRVAPDYVNFDGKNYHTRAITHPDLRASVEDAVPDEVGFGTQFPKVAQKGKMFLRVDYQPTKLYKFNGDKWIEVDKKISTHYTFNQQYIQMLIQKIGSGEYDPDLLNDAEREQIEKTLRSSGEDL